MYRTHPASSSSLLGCAVVLFTIGSPAVAFQEPVDQVERVTVRIVGPVVITRVDEPFQIQVTIDNQEEQPIAGTLHLTLIDDWQSDPASAVPFQAAAQSQTTVPFRIRPAAASYSAHYPIHAHVTFGLKGQERTAHPILVLETKLAARSPIPRPSLDGSPFLLSNDRSLALLQLPGHRAGMAVLNQPATVLPIGWTGTAEGHRGTVQIRANVALGDESREVLAIHPPWFDGQVGTAWVEYPLELPATSRIALQFATAVTPNGEGDGVTFRVRVATWEAPPGQLGAVVFERHSAAKRWEPAQVDLSDHAGRKIRLQLESHPGPKNNTAFDQSYWAEPILQAGQPQPLPTSFPPAADAAGRTPDPLNIGSIVVGQERHDVQLWLGARGLLDATIGFASGPRRLFLRGFRVRVLGLQLDDPASPVTLVESQRDLGSTGEIVVRHRFQSPHGPFDLVGKVATSGPAPQTAQALQVGFRLENAPPTRPWFAPRIEELAVSEFSHRAERVYAGHGNVLQQPGPFRLSFDGHRLATSHVGFDFDQGLSLVQGVDVPPDRLEVNPDSRHYSLHASDDATFTFVPASRIWLAARQFRETNGLRASAGVPQLAGRFVFDLWGGRYAASDEQLQRAFRYGLTDSAVVWHNWQRWGYDYRLPEIYPPNPSLGAATELRRLIDNCRQAGVLCALHDNYIDFYPDAEGFSYRHEIAFQADGRPVRAWNNESRGAQSYRYRADRVAHYLQPNLRTIQTKLGPSAYFVDVWSSIQPYDYWTSDGHYANHVSTRDSWRRHFTWMRDQLGDQAPQISESGHDQLIGWLDGAQTNHLRVGSPLPGDHSWSVWDVPCQDAERIPWFDFAHHDRFVLHGAGYSSRYEAGLDARLHGIYSDDYLATEVLTGHPAMVSHPFGRDVVRKYWLTHDLMRALALRRIDDVEFEQGDLHRQRVRWSDGGEVWVNRGDQDWLFADSSPSLPPYGFSARIPTATGLVTAAISRRQGVIVETASSSDQFYVHGREVVATGPRITPSPISVNSTGGQALSLQIAWKADDPIPEGYQPFVHFVDSRGEIAFQGAYDVRAFLQRREGPLMLTATAQLPATCRVGDEFGLRVGLYSPNERGVRLHLLGAADSEQRIRLDTITVAGTGGHITGITWQPHLQAADPLLARQNPEGIPIDFGPVRTTGGARFRREGDTLLVTPLPGGGPVRFEIRWNRLPWRMPAPTELQVLDVDGQVLARSPVSSADLVTIDHLPQHFGYRLQ